MGKPGFPRSPAGGPGPIGGRGRGGTWFPHGHVRRSCAWRTTPDAHGPGARASRPRHGSAGTMPTPSLTLPPPGAGTRRLPPAGGGWERGRTLRTMVTSAVHAAPPRTDGMKKGSSWEGYALPNPPRGRGLGARASGPRPLGYGETRFPHTPLREPMFTSAVHAAPPHNAAMHIRLFLGGLRPPKPSRGWGNGETRFPHSPLREPMFNSGHASHLAIPAQGSYVAAWRHL